MCLSRAHRKRVAMSFQRVSLVFDMSKHAIA